MASPLLETYAPNIEAEFARRYLREYVRQAWHVLEPTTPFASNWHLDAISDHLQAVSEGQIRRLLINVPPGHSKSLQTCVFWPTWHWIQHPSSRWLFASFTDDLSTRDSLKCRELIKSEWYQTRFGNSYQILGDQNQKTLFSNDKTGSRVATSVRAGTGQRADFIVWDDPHSIQSIESDDVRSAVIDSWRGVFSQRGSNPATSAFVVIMQRLHESDVVGYLLDNEGLVENGGLWHHLKLPTEYEGGHIYTGVKKYGDDPEAGQIWDDPRAKPDAPSPLLWPTRIDDDTVRSIKLSLGEQKFAGQHQQRPAPAGGAVFKTDWMQQRYTTLPTMRETIQYVDSSFKAGVANDYSVIATWGSDGKNYYLIDIKRGKWEFPQLFTTIRDHFVKHWPRILLIEDKASGQSMIQQLKAHTDIPVTPDKNLGNQSKIARAEAITPLFESGRVYLPEKAPWLDAWITEHTTFPAAAHDDQVDTTSGALNKLSRGASNATCAWLSGKELPMRIS